jgi:hypothetical protein
LAHDGCKWAFTRAGWQEKNENAKMALSPKGNRAVLEKAKPRCFWRKARYMAVLMCVCVCVAKIGPNPMGSAGVCAFSKGLGAFFTRIVMPLT